MTETNLLHNGAEEYGFKIVFRLFVTFSLLFITFWLGKHLFYSCFAVMYSSIEPVATQSMNNSVSSFLRNNRNVTIAFSIWLVTIFLLLLGGAERDVMLTWLVMAPYGIIFYWYSFHYLMPESIGKKNPFRNYAGKGLIFLILTSVPVVLIILMLTKDDEVALTFGMVNAMVQFFFTLPLSWILFKRYLKNNEKVFLLQRELGQSHANIDFLRSQINPHFLFNALNTIYGTAIEEKAERTSEGIEKLGDMMRFMLHENMQERISLSRELDYLNNYISLQKLRTDINPGIKIDTHIEQPVTTVLISPMLLIPFVENAFKHGISLREQSQIKISLELKDKILYFDVFNTKHPKPEHDPEQNKSGIGLINVKQRLKLQYPNRHELVIRETVKDFFVHLTLQLS